MNYTSKEQSEKLLEIGLEANTADMFYVQKQGIPIIMNECFAIELDLPCWSVGALLDLLPPIIIYKGCSYFMEFFKTPTPKGKWVIQYPIQGTLFPIICHQENTDKTSAIVDMLCWLHDNYDEEFRPYFGKNDE